MVPNHRSMIWICVAIVAVAVLGAAATGLDIGYAALFALPCVLMMGAMAWMMVRMSRHGGHDRR